MSPDPLPGEIRPPGAEPPEDGEPSTAGGGPGPDDVQRLGGRTPGGEPPGVGPDSIPEDEGGPIGIFPSWGWVYGTVIAWAAFLVLLLYVFTITFDYGAR